MFLLTIHWTYSKGECNKSTVGGWIYHQATREGPHNTEASTPGPQPQNCRGKRIAPVEGAFQYQAVQFQPGDSTFKNRGANYRLYNVFNNKQIQL